MRKPLLLLPFILLFAACTPGTPLEARGVKVSGEAELQVAPELAIVMLSIQARDPDLGKAQEHAGAVITRVLELADSLDIPRARVQSTQITVHPEFDWNEGRQQLRGYLVQRELRIELENLERLGELMERALRAGVNSVSPPELRVKDPREVHRQVLALAAEDAKHNAEALAEALGARVGAVRYITSGREPAPPMPMQTMSFRDARESAVEQSYETGRIVMRAEVQAEFELR